MEPQNINSVLIAADRVTSTYAEIYFDDNNVSSHKSEKEIAKIEKSVQHIKQNEEWTSPSDLLIDIVKLNPPFTSKITRGKTHEGILAIGNEVLEKEREIFLKSLSSLLQDNESSWNHILNHEKEQVVSKVKNIFQNIFKYKSDIMKKEITLFYENSLQDLENHLRSEVQVTVKTARANIISDLNRQIQQKLLKEKKKLNSVLIVKYATEISKIKRYYSLLLHNELYRNNKLINKARHERNDALRAFYKQIEYEKITSTMYVMSFERKKCKIQKMLLEKLQTNEIINKVQKIKENTDLLQDFKQKYEGISKVNQQWERKIKKILQLFLKFISFSLKIIPEQTTFLLDLEKMVVLQLNEMQKNPDIKTSILIDEEAEPNLFQFEQTEQEVPICEKEPFVLIGDLSDPIPKRYGSQETLPSDVDLPYFRVARQYIYARCHGYENIKDFLDSQKCKCNIFPEQQLSPPQEIVHVKHSVPPSVHYESSVESLLLDDIEPFVECPARKCNNWADRKSFPDLASYLDFSEANYRRVTTILSSIPISDPSPVLINPKDIAFSELPFSATKEPYHNIGTQYSSQEDINVPEVTCPCLDNFIGQPSESSPKLKYTSREELDEIQTKRKISLQRLIDKNPNLLCIFTDECFDYKL